MIFCFVIFFAFRIPCSDVLCRFHMEAMYGSSLPPVVYGRACVLFAHSVVLCVCFCFSSSCVPYVVDCSFLVAPSLFYAVCLCFGAVAKYTDIFKDVGGGRVLCVFLVKGNGVGVKFD